MNYTEYKTEIQDIAHGIIEECLKFPDIDLQDYTHQTVDGHRWIIYTSYHQDIVNNSDNEDSYLDNYGNEDLGALVAEHGLDHAIMVQAFYAMHQDVQDAIGELSHEDFEGCTEEQFDGVTR